MVQFISTEKQIEILEMAITTLKKEEAENPGWMRNGLCFHITYAGNLCGAPLSSGYKMRIYYPEVFVLRPKRAEHEMFWFPFTPNGTKKRIALLMRVVKKLKAELGNTK